MARKAFVIKLPSTLSKASRCANMTWGSAATGGFSPPHSWDWRPLIEARPLWDVVMLLLCGGGFALSVTGVVIGWRRLDKKMAARPDRQTKLRRLLHKA